MSSEYKLWFAVLVDDLRTRLQPDPLHVLGQQTVRDQTGASRLYHCKAHFTICTETMTELWTTIIRLLQRLYIFS